MQSIAAMITLVGLLFAAEGRNSHGDISFHDYSKIPGSLFSDHRHARPEDAIMVEDPSPGPPIFPRDRLLEDPASDRDPAGEDLQGNSFCRETSEKTKVDPFIHRQSYTIGVHATNGLEDALLQNEKALGTYLTETAGKMFDPPIEFKIQPFSFDDLLNAIENDEVQFFFANPGIYSCIGTQVGATALATVVKREKIRNIVHELDVYGGVIAVRHDNDGINTIHDLKDKVIGAGSIIDLMGGQMQINEMLIGEMSYVLDPKQVVFTQVQEDVVRGVLSGRFDVGFVRTNEIEKTIGADGELVDLGLFKIIDPKMFIMDNGEMFPFLHSTQVFPEWPLASLDNVPGDVQGAVQSALMNFKSMEMIGQRIQQCMRQSSEKYCFALDPLKINPTAPCYATTELGYLALQAEVESSIAGWRSAHSYFALGTVQQRAGFMRQDSNNNWYCISPSNLYLGITCPRGFYRRNREEFNTGCSILGLSCDDDPGYSCFCKPCVRAFEVNIYPHVAGESDPHHELFFGDALPACAKMEICGSVRQGETITLRIFDNEHRENP